MKKILFTVNTLSRAGAETALIEFFRRLEGKDYELYLYVMMEQGELIKNIPPYVKILNPTFNSNSVLTKKGRKSLIKTIAGDFFRNGNFFGKLRQTLKIYRSMKKEEKIRIDKLLWRTVAEGAKRFDIEFDLAVAWLEGASAYYVADYVKARKKAAVIHIDYLSSGYTREMDLDAFDKMDKIFAVSEETREHFAAYYPELSEKMGILHNLINTEKIINKARNGTGFEDNFSGVRLLTVGRLNYQKAYDTAIDSMKILKGAGYNVRWYVLGEGEERKSLEKKIAKLGLEKDFILMGATDNPYPYFAQTDIYVHATRFEGKSIAIQEAQILGRPIIATDCRGNREQIESGVDGILCELDPKAMAQSIADLIDNKEKRKAFGVKASERNHEYKEEIENFLNLIS